MGAAKECAAPPRGEHVTLWLYESRKDGERAIIGMCRLWCIIPLSHMPFGDALDLLIKEACVTEEHIRAYLPCYAWGVQDPVSYTHLDVYKRQVLIVFQTFSSRAQPEIRNTNPAISR